MIEHRLSSGQSVQAFCEAENISTATYYYWQQRLRLKENEQTSMLVPISIEKAGQQFESSEGSLELTYPNGVRITVPRHSGIRPTNPSCWPLPVELALVQKIYEVSNQRIGHVQFS